MECQTILVIKDKEVTDNIEKSKMWVYGKNIVKDKNYLKCLFLLIKVVF